jgi:putative membrane protein
MNERLALVVIGLVSLAVLAGVGALMLGGGTARGGGLDVSGLPTVNAILNGASAVLLVAGFVFIRRRQIVPHFACMLGAFAVSAMFLVSYVVYHYHAGSRAFTGQGLVRQVYFVLLITHVVLAAVILPLALTTIWRGLRAQFTRHVRVARWTLPIWLYVSVTGVLIYWMLYRL